MQCFPLRWLSTKSKYPDKMQTSICRLQSNAVQSQLVLRRSFKMKKNKNRPAQVSVIDRVLEYFDLYYQPNYKKLWPSMRIALLTQKKPLAVINNFAANNKRPQIFSDSGAYDIIQQAVTRQKELIETEESNSPGVTSDLTDEISSPDRESQCIIDTYQLDHSTTDTETSNEVKSYVLSENLRKDLDVFVSNKKLYHDAGYSEGNVDQDVESDDDYDDDESDVRGDTRVEFTALNNKVNIVKPKSLSIPEHLRGFTFPAGDISTFPAVRGDSDGRLYFYMLDGSSVLPVIALDLEKGDHVLDLCAAPGGKSITMLQTGLPASLHCNDVSRSRTEKLRTFLNFCIPRERQLYVEVTSADGQDFVTPAFNKVLVDVPCNTDRHFLLTQENNLFSRDRAQERLELPNRQRDLLVSGIKSCLPGGNVVYSTCTLAPGQNDGTVQQALDEILQTTDIQVVVEDLGEMADIFKDTFKFYKGCRFGQLVIPSLLSNFGPMYICRLKRLA